jgi:O-antigen/teichoic acid export membrane protein
MNLFKNIIEKESFQSFLKLFSSSLLVQGAAFLLSPVYARLFTPDQFGLLGLFLGILSVLSVLSTGKYEQAIMLPRSDQDARSIFWLVQVISVSFAILFLPIIIFGKTAIASLVGDTNLVSWLWFIPLLLVLHGLYQGSLYYSNRNKLFGTMATTTIVQHSALNASRLADGFAKLTSNGLVASHIFSQLVATAFLLFRTAKKVFISDAAASIKSIRKQAAIYLGYPKFNMILNFTNNLSGALPFFMFPRGFSLEMAGVFAFGYTLVFKPISMISQSLHQVLSQNIIEDHNNGRPIYQKLVKLVKRSFLIAIAPLAILVIIAPTLFRLVFPPDFWLAANMLQVLAPWLLLVFLASPLSFLPELFFRQKKAMVIDIIYLILRFVALSIGIWQQDIWLALSLYSAVGVLVVGYILHWYLWLAKNSENGLRLRSA